MSKEVPLIMHQQYLRNTTCLNKVNWPADVLKGQEPDKSINITLKFGLRYHEF